jgi:hypothetical protein
MCRSLFRWSLLLFLPILGCSDRYVALETSPNQSQGAVVFSPAPGTYRTAQTVSLTDTSGAPIYYTTDGSAPSTASHLYTAPINIPATATVQAFASLGTAVGPTDSGTYTISPTAVTPPTPDFSPTGGTYAAAQLVSLSDLDSAATIHYTTDGSQPTPSSQVYIAPIEVQASSTIRALAVDTGLDSSVASAAYSISTAVTLPPTPPAPIFAPSGGTYSSAQLVSLTDSDSTVAIHFTTDGSQPSASSPVYTAPIEVQASATIRAVAVAVDSGLDSSVASAAYTISIAVVPPNAPPAPAFAPTAGTYSTAQLVSLADADSAATIHYTTDGTQPTASSPVYTTPIEVQDSSTIRAVAIDSGVDSSVASAAYAISIAVVPPTAPPAPAFAPTAGTYSTAQLVSLTDVDSTATIHYTTDGTQPTASSPVYTTPIEVQDSSTIRAVAIDSGVDSSVASAAYAISIAVVPPTAPPAPAFAPTAGTYSTAQLVSLTDSDSTATIHYTTDGTQPTASSPVYTSAIDIQTSATIRAIAVDSGVDSSVASAAYTISIAVIPPTAPPPPVFAPGAGTYTTAQSVVLTDADLGAAIYYTQDGSTPSASSTPYTGPILVSSSQTIKAIAVLAAISSAVSSSAYVFNAPPPPTFAPAPGNYSAAVNVTLSDTDTGATIRYTTDGSTPSASSTQYTAPINVATSTSIRAVAIDNTLQSSIVTGAYNLPAVSVSSTALSFGTVSVNTSLSKSFTVTSTGSAPLTISSVVVTGTGFSISGSSLPSTLNPGQSATLTISYLPTTSNASTGQVVILTNAVNQGTIDVSLTGQGQQGAAVTVSPASGTVLINGVLQLSATVTGTTNTAVSWSVTGSGCTGVACGSISSTGVYEAPAFVPTPASVTVTATSTQTPSATGSATIDLKASGATYYLAPAGSGGNDANSGTSSSSPWLTPNHSLNCGDQIIAAPGSYSNQNFYTGKWGKVSCPAQNNVAWLTCQKFDACKISATSNQGMWVDQSYWGIQGWEITTAASDLYGTCFIAQPNYANPVEIHHIIFANDVANGCSQSGFAVVNHGSVGVDYFAVLGSIAYNASQGSGTCASGISIYQPVQSDSAAGTHLYVAGNFSYANLEPSQCNGTGPTDGEGIIFDTFDGSQGGLPSPYAAQAVAQNNVVFSNGGKGIEVFNNAVGSAHAPIYIKQNTVWGDLTDPNQNWLGCGELALNSAYSTQFTGNLVSTRSALGCGLNPIYAMAVSVGNATDQMTGNFAYGFNGNVTFNYASGTFAFGANTLGINPQFSNASTPSAPACSSSPSAPSCMASTVANFTPSASGASSFGYQAPSLLPPSDSLFPQWLCNANLPQGLVNLACQ